MTVQIIICVTTPAVFGREDFGVWEIREIEVSEELYDSRDEEAIVRPYYGDDVKYVGVYYWMD